MKKSKPGLKDPVDAAVHLKVGRVWWTRAEPLADVLKETVEKVTKNNDEDDVDEEETVADLQGLLVDPSVADLERVLALEEAGPGRVQPVLVRDLRRLQEQIC